MVRRASAVLIAIAAIAGATPAAAFDNLDKGKSAEQLFRTNCATCHKSVRGLATAKGSWTLSGFLEEHYTTSKTAADTLAAYLIAVPRWFGCGPAIPGNRIGPLFFHNCLRFAQAGSPP